MKSHFHTYGLMMAGAILSAVLLVSPALADKSKSSGLSKSSDHSESGEHRKGRKGRHKGGRDMEGGISSVSDVTPFGQFNLMNFLIVKRRTKLQKQQAHFAARNAGVARQKARDADEESGKKAKRAYKAANKHLRRILDKSKRLWRVGLGFTMLRRSLGSRIGVMVDEEIERRYGFYKEITLEKRLFHMVRKLKIISLRLDEPLRVRIFNPQKDVRFVVASPTTIYFNKAYIDTSPSDDELKFVIGREIAHTELNHMVEGIPFYASLTATDIIDGKMNKILGSYSMKGSKYTKNEVFQFLQSAVQVVLKGKYSSLQTQRADILGAQISRSRKASPRGIKEAFDRIEAQGTSNPPVSERLSYLEKFFGPRFWEKDEKKTAKK